MKEKNLQFFLIKRASKVLKKIVPNSIYEYIKNIGIYHAIKVFNEKYKEPCAADSYQKGINLIGSIKAEMGLGQSCRLAANQIVKSNYPFSIYNIKFDKNIREGESSFDRYISEDLPYSVNLFHVNPAELSNLFLKKKSIWNKRYNIAFWLWELQDFPDEWVKYCKLFDEVWTPSKFASNSIRKKTKITVKTMPYSVSAPYCEAYGRKEFRLPEDLFLFLIMYDSNSTSSRKNPKGAINAFKKSFAPDKRDVGLVIKINNANENDLNTIQKEMKGYKNVYFIAEVLDKMIVNSLINCVDVFVSLHRAEGFGLVMAEAMLLGTPVIATNWSSNTEFMNSDVACMVDYKLVENTKTVEFYKKGCIWAEPDIFHASYFMKKLETDKEFYETLQTKGKLYINQKLNEEKIADLWKKEFSILFNDTLK